MNRRSPDFVKEPVNVPDLTMSVHARVPAARFEAALGETLAPFGLAPTGPAALDAPGLVVHLGPTWCALHDPAWVTADADALGPSAIEWAQGLSHVLGEPVLSLVTWEGEGSVQVRRYDAGAEAATLDLPDGLKRTGKGRVAIPVDVLAPWLGEGARPLPVRPTKVQRQIFGLGDVGREDVVAALSGALGLHVPWIDGSADGVEGDGSRVKVIALRRLTAKERAAVVARSPKTSATAPVLPGKPAVRGKAAREAIETYRGRKACVAWVAFAGDEAARLAALTSVVPKFLAEYLPKAGARARVTRGGKRGILGEPFTERSRLKSEALAKGGRVELFTGSPDDVDHRGAQRFWFEHVIDGSTPFATLGWSFDAADPLLASTRRLLDLAEDTFWWAMILPGCVGGGLTLQGRGLLPDDALPYETLAGTEGRWRDPAWLADHTRSPGWRVRLSYAQYAKTGKALPAHARLTDNLPARAVLFQVDASGAEARGATHAAEEYLLPLLGR